MIEDLIRELEDYAEVAQEGEALYCARLMRQAAMALRKKEDRTSGGNGHAA